MNFILVEIYMTLISLIFLVILSLTKLKNTVVWNLWLLSVFITLVLIYDSGLGSGFSVYLFNYSLNVNTVTWVLKLIVICFFFNYIYFFKSYFIIEKVYLKELLLLIWISIIGVYFLMMANEFFVLFLALELQNLILYILTSLRRKRSVSIEASIKYYIMGSFSSGLFLYGMVMLFGLMGTLDFNELSLLLSNWSYLNLNFANLLIFLIFILVGLLFKLGVVPFHWWVPEVYEGAPVIVTLYFLIIPKLALLIVIGKLYMNLFIYFNFFFNSVLVLFSVLTLLVGFILGLYQKTLIKLMAYSSIFNSGFFLASIANGTYLSLIYIWYFFLPYIVILLGIFFVVISFRKLNGEKFSLLWDFSVLANTNVLLGFVLSIFFMSLAGIPPLSGFFGKFFLLFAFLLNKNIFLFFILIIFSVASSFYYFRVVRFLFFNSIIEYTFLKPTLNSLWLVIYLYFTIGFFMYYDFFLVFFFNIYFYG